MLVSIHKLALVTIALLALANRLSAQVWTLQQCIDTALVYNRTLQVAGNNNRISRERQREAKANLLPKLSVNADYKYFSDLPTQLMPLSTFTPSAPEGQFKEARFGVPHNIGANLQVTLPIYQPQLIGGIQIASVAAELSQLQYQKTAEQVTSDISNWYYNAQLLLAQNLFTDSNLVNTERLLQNMRLLKEQQMATGTDVGKVELQRSRLQVQKANVSARLQQVMNALKFSMGIAPDRVIEISPALRLESEVDYDNNNPTDIQIAIVQHKLAEADLKNAKRSRLPAVALFGSYGTTGFGYYQQPDNFLKFYPVNVTGIQLTYPLFSGTVTQRKINQKKMEVKNSELLQTMAVEQNTIQIQNTSVQRDVARQTILAAQADISQASTIYSQTLLLQRQGLASLTEVLLADAALRETQTGYLTAIVDYLKADIELKRLTGNFSTTKP